MKDRPEFIINENPPLIADDLVLRAKKLSSSLLSDATDGSGVMDFRIKPIIPKFKLIGTAMTVSLKADDNLFLHKAIYLAANGYVLVADGKGYSRGAAWGEMMSQAAMAIGVEGVVLDGVIRDIVEIRALRFPVFAKGAVPSGMSRIAPGAINCAISCGGAAVIPGDLVFGDDDGVVIVPRAKIDEVLAKAERKLVLEEQRIQEIENGKLEPDWVRERVKDLMP